MATPRWVLFASLYAFGMSFLYIIVGAALPSVGGNAVPISFSFTTTGLLGVMVFLVQKAQDERLRRLEECDRDRPHA